MEQNLPFDLDALLVFGKVVESRSLSKAAVLLGMPKSTVSRKLTQTRVGPRHQAVAQEHASADRHGPRRKGLQPCGEHPDGGQRRARPGRGQQAGTQGELRVAIPIFLGIDYASRVGAAFLQHYPHSRLDIRLVDNLVDPIKDGFDVVFGTGPLQDSTLIARKVFSLELFLCASPDFVAQLPEPDRRSGTAGRRAVHRLRFRRAAQGRAWPSRSGATSCRRTIRARANNFQVCKQYILQGLGIGAMPTQIICTDELREGSIVPVLPDWKPRGDGRPHDLSVRALLLDTHQCVLRDRLRDHRREFSAKLG